MKLSEILTEGKVSEKGIDFLQNLEEEINSYKETIKKLEDSFGVRIEKIKSPYSYTSYSTESLYYSKEEFENEIISELRIEISKLESELTQIKGHAMEYIRAEHEYSKKIFPRKIESKRLNLAYRKLEDYLVK